MLDPRLWTEEQKLEYKAMMLWAEKNGWPELAYRRVNFSELKEIEFIWNACSQPRINNPDPPYDQGDESCNYELDRLIESEMGRHTPSSVWFDERFMPEVIDSPFNWLN